MRLVTRTTVHLLLNTPPGEESNALMDKLLTARMASYDHGAQLIDWHYADDTYAHQEIGISPFYQPEICPFPYPTVALDAEPTERVTIDFNALSCAAQGYSRLTAEQKGHLVSVAADIFLTNLVFTRAVTKAFREAADRLDYQSEGAAEDFATLEENSNA